MSTELDLFWSPQPGELAELAPEVAEGWWSKAEAAHPVRIVRQTEISDWYVVVGTEPVRVRTNSRGRVIREEPTVQSFCQLSDLRQLTACRRANAC